MTSRIDAPDTDADREIRAILDFDHLTGFTVTAGAGSGKTTSLVKALAHISGSNMNGGDCMSKGVGIAELMAGLHITRVIVLQGNYAVFSERAADNWPPANIHIAIAADHDKGYVLICQFTPLGSLTTSGGENCVGDCRKAERQETRWSYAGLHYYV